MLYAIFGLQFDFLLELTGMLLVHMDLEHIKLRYGQAINFNDLKSFDLKSLIKVLFLIRTNFEKSKICVKT